MMRNGVATLLFAITAGAQAATPQTWPISSAQSSVKFGVRTLWFTHERGRFDDVHGQLRRNDADQDVVDAWIDAGSLAMDDDHALKEARGPGFFDVVRFPRIHFVSYFFPDVLLRQGGSMSGVLDLHGRRQWVQFTVQPSACPARPPDCAIRLHGALSRSAFDMRAHRGLLSDKVVVDLDIVLGEPG